jgi:hypothetical protein
MAKKIIKIVQTVPDIETPQIKVDLRIIKVGQCPTLSGRSTLTYEVGFDATSKIYFKLIANSAPGYFNSVPVALVDVEKVFAGVEMVHSYMLRYLAGASSNSPGFVLALLKQEGIVMAMAGESKKYIKGDMAAFKADMQKRIAEIIDKKGKSKASAAPLN